MKNLITRIALFVLNFFGVSIEDLVAYAKNHTEIRNSSKKLPLEILYENDYRSFFFEPLKTPVAIICGDLGVALEDTLQGMGWDDAREYCKKYLVGGKKWSLPNYEAGDLKALYENKEAISEVLRAFGKEPLKEDNWHWASEGERNAWLLDLSDGNAYAGDKGINKGYVFPVTKL